MTNKYSIFETETNFIPGKEKLQLKKQDEDNFIITNNNSQFKNKLISISKSKFFQNIFSSGNTICFLAAISGNIYYGFVKNSLPSKRLAAFTVLSGLGSIAFQTLELLRSDDKLQDQRKEAIEMWLKDKRNQTLIKYFFTPSQKENIKQDIDGRSENEIPKLYIDQNYNNKNINQSIKNNLKAFFEAVAKQQTHITIMEKIKSYENNLLHCFHKKLIT